MVQTIQEWKWVSGKPMTKTYWGKGEPNDYGRNEDCVVSHRAKYWNDLRCNAKVAFACQIIDWEMLSDGKRALYISSPETWSDAEKICEARGGTLIIDDSTATHNWLSKYDVWIGIN